MGTSSNQAAAARNASGWCPREELLVFLEEAFGDPDSVQAAPGGRRIKTAFFAFINALDDKASVKKCLRAWSLFVRVRDGGRCVLCHSEARLSAHHICRKSFLPIGQFQTGNGITLCRPCHVQIHAGFNGRPDMKLPMDEQGGEKIEKMLKLYGALVQDAHERELLNDQYYFLSTSVLSAFKRFQGLEPTTPFCGFRIEQAYQIWRAPPQEILRAVLKSLLE